MQTEQNTRLLGKLPFEAIALSIVAGIYFDSWYVGAIVCLVLFVGCLIKPLATILTFTLIAGWGVAAYIMAKDLSLADGAKYIIPVIVMLIAFALHLQDIEYVGSIGKIGRHH